MVAKYLENAFGQFADLSLPLPVTSPLPFPSSSYLPLGPQFVTKDLHLNSTTVFAKAPIHLSSSLLAGLIFQSFTLQSFFIVQERLHSQMSNLTRAEEAYLQTL